MSCVAQVLLSTSSITQVPSCTTLCMAQVPRFTSCTAQVPCCTTSCIAQVPPSTSCITQVHCWTLCMAPVPRCTTSCLAQVPHCSSCHASLSLHDLVPRTSLSFHLVSHQSLFAQPCALHKCLLPPRPSHKSFIARPRASHQCLPALRASHGPLLHALVPRTSASSRLPPCALPCLAQVRRHTPSCKARGPHRTSRVAPVPPRTPSPPPPAGGLSGTGRVGALCLGGVWGGWGWGCVSRGGGRGVAGARPPLRSGSPARSPWRGS